MWQQQVGQGEYLMFSFARRGSVWLSAVAVKAQDELAALGLDRHRRQPQIA